MRHITDIQSVVDYLELGYLLFAGTPHWSLKTALGEDAATVDRAMCEFLVAMRQIERYGDRYVLRRAP
jgi:hypothetical protein